MNPILAEILKAQTVSDGKVSYPIEAHVDLTEGELLQRVIRTLKPQITLEVGMAYGISTLFICDALAEVSPAARHIVLDPFQTTHWKGIGLRNVERAGYSNMVEHRATRSEFGLPELLSEELTVGFALIDGYHTFDQTLVDFYFINRLLAIGGVIAIDDTDMPAVRKVVDHALTYPCYTMFDSNRQRTRGGRRTQIRRWLARTTGMSAFRRDWDETAPTCIAMQKTAPDERAWNWHKPF